MNNPTKNGRTLLDPGSKANADAKVTLAGLMFEYALLHNINIKDRVIVISGDIDSSKFDLIEAGLTLLESESRKAITIRINSAGGEVYQAVAIVGRLRRSKCQIITEGYGQIMSAATLILACGDRRKISDYAFFMHHETSYAVEGKHSEITSLVKQSEIEDQKWCDWMAGFSNKSADFWKTAGVGTDLYLSAQQILEYGLVDEII